MATQPLTEFWGWCSDCARWFYCGRDTERGAAAVECPVCLRLPAELEPRQVAQQ